MNKEAVEAMIEALIDLRVEITAIHKALEQAGIPTESVQAWRIEVDREKIESEIRKNFGGTQSIR